MLRISASFLSVSAASGYVLNAPSARLAPSRGRSLVMEEELVDMLNVPTWGDAREGKPFGAADGLDASGNVVERPLGMVRNAVEAYQPRGISDASVIKPAYIETDDEPW